MATETELERMVVRLIGDTQQYLAAMKGAAVQTETYATSISASLGGIKTAIAGVAAAAVSLGGLYQAGKFEQTKIAFETMIGSVQETQSTLERLTTFAAETPFEMPEIEQAARGLIMFGERGDELMGTLNILGNAAAGTSSDFGMIALIFNQIRGVGKLLTQDFRQLSSRGVISLADIAKYYGVTTEAAQEMLSTGKISFNDLKGILASLSQEGGRFYNLMERQSTSLLGLWSTLKDAIGITSRQIGEVLLPTAKQFVQAAIQAAESTRNWVSEHSTLIDVIAKAAVAFGIYKVAVLASGMALSGLNKIAKTTIALQSALSAMNFLSKGSVAAGATYQASTSAAAMAERAAAVSGTTLTSGMNMGQSLSMAKMMKQWGAEAAAANATKAAVTELTGAVGTYGAMEVATGQAIASKGVGATLMAGGAYAVIAGELAVLGYEIYDLYSSYKTYNNEKEKGIELDKQIADVVAKNVEMAKKMEKEAKSEKEAKFGSFQDGWEKLEQERIRQRQLIEDEQYRRIKEQYGDQEEAQKKVLEEARFELQATQKSWSEIEKSVQSFIQTNEKLDPFNITHWKEEAKELRNVLKGIEQSKFDNTLKGMADNLSDLAKNLNNAAIAATKWARENKNATVGQISSYYALTKMNEMVQEGKRVQEEYLDPLDKIIEKQNHLRELYRAGVIDVETLGKAIRKTQQEANKGYQSQFRQGGAEAILSGKQASIAFDTYKAGTRMVPAGEGQQKRVQFDNAKMEGYLKELTDLAKNHWTGNTVQIEAAGFSD